MPSVLKTQLTIIHMMIQIIIMGLEPGPFCKRPYL